VKLLQELCERLLVKLKSWVFVISNNERDFLDFMLAGIAVLVICALIYVFA